MAADPQSAASPCKPDAPWTVRDARVNLSALLNDPGRSRRDYDLFTKTWGETFKDLPPGMLIILSCSVQFRLYTLSVLFSGASRVVGSAHLRLLAPRVALLLSQ